MIVLENVYKRYQARTAVNGVTLTVNEGEIFGLVGPDGAGKTSVIRMLTGVTEPTSGRISVMGKQNLEDIKGEIGYIPQKFSLYGDLTVMENISLIGSLYGASRRDIEVRAAEILGFTKLLPFKGRLADQLSGGMKQKLALAAGLMHRPRIFFLDEPTTGVDPVSRREFWQMLYRLNKEGMTVFVSTPYMDEAELCTRVAFMHNGNIVSCAAPKELTENYPYRLLELHAMSKDVKNRLAGMPIHEINAFGDKYHLVVDRPEAVIPDIKAKLSGEGIEVLALAEIKPTLEDVFVALAGEESYGE